MSTGQRLVDWMMARLGQYRYTLHMVDRSNPASGATDCSALVQRAYQDTAGIDPGSWTGAQMRRGHPVFGPEADLADALALLQPGDLIFFDWDGIRTADADHVEMYIGCGKTIGHGGPGPGPTIKTLAAQWAAAHTITARRYLDATNPTTKEDDMPTAKEIADAILDAPIARQGLPAEHVLAGHATTLRAILAHADANTIQTNGLIEAINLDPAPADAAAVVNELAKRLTR